MSADLKQLEADFATLCTVVLALRAKLRPHHHLRCLIIRNDVIGTLELRVTRSEIAYGFISRLWLDVLTEVSTRLLRAPTLSVTPDGRERYFITRVHGGGWWWDRPRGPVHV